MRLGERDFWAGVRLYLKRHAFEQVETDQFRLCLEEVTGQSLERFFDQWCKRPGHPNLEIDYSWTPANADQPTGPGRLTVTVEQIQRIDADNPAYAFQLPVYAQFAKDLNVEGEYVYLLCDTRVTTMTFDLPHRPKSLSIDPYLTVLCRKRVRTSLEAAADQLLRGPTFAARLQAIDDLAARPSWDAVRTLAAAAVAGASAAADSRLRRVAPHALAAAIDSAVAAARDDARHIAAAWHAARRGSPHAIASR
jgi:aminopeptidase N